MPENADRVAHLWSHRSAAGLPCPEREGLDHDTPAGMRPSQKMCIRCGRVTARRGQNGYAWCGGQLPEVTHA